VKNLKRRPSWSYSLPYEVRQYFHTVELPDCLHVNTKKWQNDKDELFAMRGTLFKHGVKTLILWQDGHESHKYVFSNNKDTQQIEVSEIPYTENKVIQVYTTYEGGCGEL
jgi:hypothetical protein